MGSNLLKRGNTWFVRVAVPRSLQSAVGRREVQRTTGTTDIRTAERRKHAIIAAIKNEIDELAGPQNDPSSPAWVTASVRAIRKSMQRGEIPEDVAYWIVGEIQDKHLAALGTHRDDPNVPEQVVTRLRSAARVVSDPEHIPLSELIETYLSDREPKVATSTLDMKRRELEAFASWLDSDPAVSEVTRRDTGRYISEVLATSGRSEKTQKDVVGALSAFWNWTIRKGYSDHANPWSGLTEDLKGSRRGSVSNRKRRPWKPTELEKIASIDPADPMYQLCMISAYSGMRLNEIAHLEETDVDLEAGMFCLPEGKTESSVRQVPIHPAILPLVESLHDQAKGGFLIRGLKPGGRDKKRGHSVSKRIGRWIRQNVTSDKGVVFHSLRNTFMHACENAGVLESTTQLLVGHARQSLTYGLYSPGVHFKLLQEAIQKISYETLQVVERP